MDVGLLSESDRDVLRKSVLLSGMAPDILTRIVRNGTVVSKKKNEFLFDQGQPSENLFIILEGWVQIQRNSPDGAMAVIAVFKKGESLAESVTFLNKPYPASAQAITEMRVFSVNSRFVSELLQEDAGVLQGVMSSLYLKLHELMSEVESLKSRNLRERLAMFLLYELEDSETAKRIELPFGKAQIAARIGTSPEQLSRTFRELKEIGVKINGRVAEIDDPEGLRAMLRRS